MLKERNVAEKADKDRFKGPKTTWHVKSQTQLPQHNRRRSRHIEHCFYMLVFYLYKLLL